MLSRPEFETGNWKLETRNSKLKADPLFAGEFRVSNSEFRNPVGGGAVAAVVAVLALANTRALFGQGCAMCYNTAAAAKTAAVQALRSGILILLVPVALMFIGIFVLVFRSKERFSGPSQEEVNRDRGLRDWFQSLAPNSESVNQCVSESANSTAVD